MGGLFVPSVYLLVRLRGILVFKGFFRNFSGLNFKGCGL